MKTIHMMNLNFFFLKLSLIFSFAIATTFDPANSFEKFISHYRIQIEPVNYEFRKGLYTQEQKRILAHNNANKGWNETINTMTILTVDERKQFYGYAKGVKQYHTPISQIKNMKSESIDLSLLPKNVDWRTKGVVTAVKSQGGCGSCWAFASTAVIESHVAINTNKLYDLSPQQIATCAPNPLECGGKGNCQGATAELAFDYVANSGGLYDEFQMPYTEYYGVESKCALPSDTPRATISGYVKLEENNYEQLMYAVATVGPIAVSVDASNWHSYSSGIFNGCNQSNPDINHAVVLVGYGTDYISGQDYWLVRNSWSASWGESGYIRLLRQKITAYDDDDETCGMDITPQDGTACAGDNQPVKVCGTCGILYDSSYPTGANTI
jgi:cathepsin L